MADRPPAAALEHNFHVGVISGTSMDGLDVALLNCASQPPQLVAAHTAPLPGDLSIRLRRLAQADGDSINLLGAADAELGEAIGNAVNSLLADAGISNSQVQAIGSHGQTIRHQPTDTRPWTLQIGDPTRIAEFTGIPVVADFRRADMAAGGQGAPLVPAFHAALLGSSQHRLVLNLGGIGNLTLIPPAGSGEPVRGFDTGPANTLMDAWFRSHHQGNNAPGYDLAGAWAASGRVLPELLDLLLAEPWLQQAPPRSTGPELFNLLWLQQRLDRLIKRQGTVAPADVQATLADLSVQTIADAVHKHLPTTAEELLLCGGGAHNSHLCQRLAVALPRHRIRLLDEVLPSATAVQGNWGDALEAAAFAWFAYQFTAGHAGNVPEVTGARGPRILGALWPAPGRASAVPWVPGGPAGAA